MNNGTEWVRPSQIYSTKAKAGMLPIGPSCFYDLLNKGKLPQPDSQLEGTKLWKRTTIETFLLNQKPN